MQKTYANPFMGPFCPFWQKCVFLEILLLPFFTIIDLVSLYQIKKKNNEMILRNTGFRWRDAIERQKLYEQLWVY